MTARRCPACSGTVRDAAGRFCPTCGSSLPELPSEVPGAHRGHEDVAAAQSEAMHAAGRGPKLIALAVLVLGGLALLGSWAGWFPDQSQDAAGDGVELPDADDLDEDDGEDQQAGDPDDLAAPDDATPDDDEAEPRCRPDGCERWAIPAGPGPALVDDGRILHLDAGELLGIDAADGAVTPFGPSELPVGEATGLLLVERSDGDLLLVHDGEQVEVWELTEGGRVWHTEGDDVDERAGGVVCADDDVVVVVEVEHLEDDPQREVVAYDTATGEPRWSHDGVVLGAAGPIVIQAPDDATPDSDEVVLVDATSGEVEASVEPGEYRGGTDDRVALEQDGRVVWRSWPDLDEVADLGPAGETPPIVNGHLVSGSGTDGMSAPAGVAVEQIDEVVDPSDGGLVASYDEPVAVGQRPDADGGVVAQRDGSTVTVTAVDADWQERWRAEVAREPTDEQPVWVVPTLGSATVASGGGDTTDEHWQFDWRTGLPLRTGEFGQLVGHAEVSGTVGGLELHATSEQVTLAGPDGEIAFDDASAEILHASDPLLVRVDHHLIAVDETLVSSP